MTTKGHGRLETRQIRVSSELAGYRPLPGLAQVAEVRTRITSLSTGHLREQTHYLVTSLTPAQASPRHLLHLHRQHWGIENRLFHVKDDRLGEDRHVLQRRTSGTVLCHLRNTAFNLLGAKSRLWAARDYIPARCQYLGAQPLAALIYETGS